MKKTILLTAAAAGSFSQLYAQPVIYQIIGGEFYNGRSLSGTFTYDFSAGLFSNINLTEGIDNILDVSGNIITIPALTFTDADIYSQGIQNDISGNQINNGFFLRRSNDIKSNYSELNIALATFDTSFNQVFFSDISGNTFIPPFYENNNSKLQLVLGSNVSGYQDPSSNIINTGSFAIDSISGIPYVNNVTAGSIQSVPESKSALLLLFGLIITAARFIFQRKSSSKNN